MKTLKFSLKNKKQTNNLYINFIKNGSLFIPTDKLKIELKEEIKILVKFIELSQEFEIICKVVYISYDNKNFYSGFIVQFPKINKINEFIKDYIKDEPQKDENNTFNFIKKS